VDAEGAVLDVRRNKRAALKLMRKLLKKYGFVPDKLVTDDLRSYRAAASDLGIAKRRERGRWRNNRAENSHQQEDARVQERGIRAKISLSRCSSPQHLQRPTPSHLSANATSVPFLGDENMASGRPSFRQLDKATERWDLFDPARPEGAEFHVKA
jgi:transposase-like protein